MFSRIECESRYEIMVEDIEKVIGAEANTMLEMARRQILPAVIRYTGEAAASYENLTRVNLFNDDLGAEIRTLSEDISKITHAIAALQKAADAVAELDSHTARARAMVDQVRPCMEALRAVCDHAETMVDSAYWPMPTYTDLLHRV